MMSTKNLSDAPKRRSRCSLVLGTGQVLRCLGSDGRKYSQLVKGKDDLRLDAVMQQLFGVVNQFLALSPETAKRKLALRTYKVCGLPMPASHLHPTDIYAGVCDCSLPGLRVQGISGCGV